MKNQDFIRNILEEHNKAIAIIKLNFSALNYQQLNYKVSGNSWSIGECITHLLVTNNEYIGYFENALKNKSDLSDKNFKHSFIGKLIIKTVNPSTKIKTKTPQKFNPQSSNIELKIIEKYLDQHKKIHHLMETSLNLDLKKFKIISPFNKMVKYNLGDSFAIISYHDQRHAMQALRVFNSPDFPR
jgi:hypothetical protein